MEIRTLEAQERLAVAELLDGWRLAEGYSAGDRFRQQVESDPGYSDENVFVAVEQGKVVGCLVLLPRRLRILGHDLPTAAMGGLATTAEWRGRGVATELLERAIETARTRGLELALAFPGAPPATLSFFEKRGWHAWGGQQTILRRDATATPPPSSGGEELFELQVVDPTDERSLASVRSIHAAYAGSRSGTVVRDDALWRSSLEMQAAREEFWIARRGGLSVAYARAAIIDDVLSVTEFGRFEDGAEALARLISGFLEPRPIDILADRTEGRIASEELRSFLVLPTFDDLGLTVALEHRGVRSHPMDDSRAAFLCVNLIGLASRLDVDLLGDEDGQAFLRRILPPDAMVFWPADRF